MVLALSRPHRGGHRVCALRRQREEVLRFCGALTAADWATPSAADSWTVHDVVAHLAANGRAIFTPAAIALLRTDDIERTNDELLERYRTMDSAAVLAEFATWSARVGALAGVLERTPVARAPMPLGELGLFPVGLVLTGAFTFDMQTHLHHDIATALGRPAPGSDAERTDVVLAWMLAVLSNQLRAAPEQAPDRPVVLELVGPGGGSWTVCPDGAIAPRSAAGTIVRAPVEGFGSWATRRSRWRDHDVTVTGDEEAATRFLDRIRVV